LEIAIILDRCTLIASNYKGYINITYIQVLQFIHFIILIKMVIHKLLLWLVVLNSTIFIFLTFLSYFNGRNIISYSGAFGLLNDAAAFLAHDEWAMKVFHQIHFLFISFCVWAFSISSLHCASSLVLFSSSICMPTDRCVIFFAWISLINYLLSPCWLTHTLRRREGWRR